MAHDSYYMKFTDEAAWLQFKDDELWTSDPPPGEEEGYKEWVQGVVELPQVLEEYMTGVPSPDPENPVYLPSYYVHIMTNGRKAVCQAEVPDPYFLTLPHMFQGGVHFQKNWKKYDT